MGRSGIVRGACSFTVQGLVGASEDQGQSVPVGDVASFIIPVGGTSGALIPGASSILYTEGQESELSAALPTTIIKVRQQRVL